MTISLKHSIKITVTTLVVTVLFSCKSNFKEIQQIGVLQNEPIGIAENINLKYTEVKDSIGKLIANLESPKMLDYSNREFSYIEFPDGVTLYLYSEKNERNTVLADYALVYSETDLIDLQGNVILITPQNDSLFADQMYYDQKQEWLFSNQPVSLKSATANSGKGNIFDSDTSFKNYTILEGRGDMILKE